MSIDEAIHRFGIAIGALAVGVGLVLLFLPDVALSIPIGLLFADVAAIAAVMLAGYVVRERYRSKPNRTVVPDVEYPLSTGAPGADVDELVYRVTRLREGTIEYRERIQERIAEIAAAVVMEREDCSREAAIDMLREGTWTDDGAAAFFTGGGSSSPSFLQQLRQRFTGTGYQYEGELRRIIGAIEERADALVDDGRVDRDGEADSERDPGMEQAAVELGDEGEAVTEGARYRSLIPTDHWAGVSAFALLAIAVGTISSQPALVLASAAGLAVAGYSRAWSPPPVADLDVTRSLSDEQPQPGDEVEVTVTVENTGDSFLTDLRLVDRVPPTSTVVDGSPRLGTALRPAGTASFTYTLIAERGEHTWPVQVIGRDPSGAVERDARIEPETTMHCVPRLKTTVETPVRLQTSVYEGQVDTKSGGDGLEFFSVRDYLPGDPMRRINWKTYARTGEFSTVDFRKERAAKVVLMFDTRESAYVAPEPGRKHAVERSIDAAFDVFASLYDGGHLIGLAAFDTVPCWLGPSTGDAHLERARRLFVDHPALSPLPPDVADKEGRYVDPMTHIRRQLPQNTQIFLFSPLTDDYAYEVARRLNGAGHLITVVSPDPTAAGTIGERLARLERIVRINRLREHGIRVVDWSDDRPLGLELEHARRRW
jgi:uncharacterized repeat protein (TIGR01451 family)